MTPAFQVWFEKAQRLIIDVCNTSHYCGDWRNSDDEDYETVWRRAHDAKEALEAHLLQAPQRVVTGNAAPTCQPVGHVYRYGKDMFGRPWHGIHWYDANVDVPSGTKLYLEPPAAPAIRADERERCAQWCDGLAGLYQADVAFDTGYRLAATRAARDIRAALYASQAAQEPRD